MANPFLTRALAETSSFVTPFRSSGNTGARNANRQAKAIEELQFQEGMNALSNVQTGAMEGLANVFADSGSLSDEEFQARIKEVGDQSLQAKSLYRRQLALPDTTPWRGRAAAELVNTTDAPPICRAASNTFASPSTLTRTAVGGSSRQTGIRSAAKWIMAAG